jgi:hypothetical protein
MRTRGSPCFVRLNARRHFWRPYRSSQEKILEVRTTLRHFSQNPTVSAWRRHPGAEMVTQNSVDLVESFWKEVWQTPDNINAVDRLVTDDFVVTTGGRDIVGREAFKAMDQ